MTAPRRIIELCQDAVRRGYTVVNERGRIMIMRKHKRTGRVLQGLVIYPNGTALDLCVRLDIAKGLRSDADMRRVLGLR